MTPLPEPIPILLALLAATAAVSDLRFRQIPNWLVLAGAVAGITANVYLLHWAGLWRSLEGFALATAIYLPLYALRAVGGGDLKLMVAIGMLTGPRDWLDIFLITAVAGGVLAAGLVLTRGALGRTLRNIGYILNELIHLRAPHTRRADLDIASPQALTLPHAVAIAIGSFIFLAAHRFVTT